jgi:hypothetical protein
MSEEIDMKNLSGEDLGSAAGGQQIVGQNSYQEATQTEDVFVHKEFLEPAKEEPQAPLAETQGKNEEIVAQEPVSREPSKQELNFKALREEIDHVKAEREDLRANIELMRANMATIAQQQHKQEAPKQDRLFEHLKGDDIPNVQDIEAAWSKREADYQARIEELQVAQKFTDYAEVMEKYTSPLLKQKPHLAEGILGAKNKALQAYELGKMHQMAQQQPQIQQPVAVEPNKVAQKIVENARKPGSLSSAGGQSALSQADYFATMSDNEFMKFASKNLEGI